MQESEWLRLRALEAHGKPSKSFTEGMISSGGRDGPQYKSDQGLADASMSAEQIILVGFNGRGACCT